MRQKFGRTLPRFPPAKVRLLPESGERNLPRLLDREVVLGVQVRHRADRARRGRLPATRAAKLCRERGRLFRRARAGKVPAPFGGIETLLRKIF